MSRLWQLLAALLAALAAIAGVAATVLRGQRDRARGKAATQQRRADSAEASIDQRQRAEEASEAAKEEGDARVDQVRHEARAGRRDHFERDRLRDDD